MVAMQPGLVFSEGKYFKIFKPSNIWLQSLTDLDLLNPQGLKSTALHIKAQQHIEKCTFSGFPVHEPKGVNLTLI